MLTIERDWGFKDALLSSELGLLGGTAPGGKGSSRGRRQDEQFQSPSSCSPMSTKSAGEIGEAASWEVGCWDVHWALLKSMFSEPHSMESVE